jgi:hypothetical protein
MAFFQNWYQDFLMIHSAKCIGIGFQVYISFISAMLEHSIR